MWIRIAIPIFRLMSFYRAIWIVGYPQFISLAAPMQKQFVVPLAEYIWSILALMPFIVIRTKAVFYLYVGIMLSVLTVMLYDFCIPYSYSVKGVEAPMSNSRYEVNDTVVYWSSFNGFPDVYELLMGLVFVVPFILSIVYRRSFHLWTRSAEQDGG